MLQALKTNLIPNQLYKLTKIGVKNEDSRYFKEGDTHVGQASLYDEDRLYVGGVMTSSVVSFSQNGDNFVIETKNSIYSLEKLDNE